MQVPDQLTDRKRLANTVRKPLILNHLQKVCPIDRTFAFQNCCVKTTAVDTVHHEATNGAHDDMRFQSSATITHCTRNKYVCRRWRLQAPDDRSSVDRVANETRASRTLTCSRATRQLATSYRFTSQQRQLLPHSFRHVRRFACEVAVARGFLTNRVRDDFQPFARER